MTAPWGRWAARAARSVERQIDGLRDAARTRGARQVVAYRGFGNEHEVHVSGRVLGNPPQRGAAAGDTWWQNLASSLRHLESDEIPGARVRLRFHDSEAEAITDEEGFFRAWLRPASLLSAALWHEVQLDVIDRVHPDAGRVRGTAQVLVPPATAEFGIISDIDDTVIRTDATRLISMLRRTLLDNALTRLPFEGVSAFYRALNRGSAHEPHNPIFYVSSSPWNLYSVLSEFLDHQGIPTGPLQLRDWGITDEGVLPRGHGAHKLGAIRQIMGTYPDLPFILIGDSGQEDPEIYHDVVHEHGDRIRAVYIRNVTPPERARSITELAEEVRTAGSELLLTDDTLAAARHAAARGWILHEAVQDVETAVRASEARPG